MDTRHAEALQKNNKKNNNKPLINVFNVKSYLFVFLWQLKSRETDSVFPFLAQSLCR